MACTWNVKYFLKKYHRFTTVLTGPNDFINISLTSNHPLNDKTSNKVNMASPMLSKLKRLGFALENIVYYTQ